MERDEVLRALKLCGSAAEDACKKCPYSVLGAGDKCIPAMCLDAAEILEVLNAET